MSPKSWQGADPHPRLYLSPVAGGCWRHKVIFRTCSELLGQRCHKTMSKDIKLYVLFSFILISGNNQNCQRKTLEKKLQTSNHHQPTSTNCQKPIKDPCRPKTTTRPPTGRARLLRLLNPSVWHWGAILRRTVWQGAVFLVWAPVRPERNKVNHWMVGICWDGMRWIRIVVDKDKKSQSYGYIGLGRPQSCFNFGCVPGQKDLPTGLKTLENLKSMKTQLTLE